MPLTRNQFETLARVTIAGMHYSPGVSALLAGDGAPTKVHLASARRLVEGGYVEVDDQDVWRISAAGAAELEQHPHYVAGASVADGLRQGEAVVTDIWRKKAVGQHTVNEEILVSEEVTDALRRSGSIQVSLAELTVSPDEWRRIARAAARFLGRPVQTLLARDQLVAVLTDWPATPVERRDHDRRLRAAISAAAGIGSEGDGSLRHSPRQDRSASTVARLQDAARHVLATIGRDRFTTSDIAVRAGVSIGTFYRYFDDRAQILDHIWPDRRDTHLTPETPAKREPTG